MSTPSAARLLAELARAGKAKVRIAALSPDERVDRMLRGVRTAKHDRRKLAAHLKAEVADLRAEFSLGTMHQYLCSFRKAIALEFGPEHPAIPMLYSEPAAKRLGFVGLGFTADEVKSMKLQDRRRVAQTLKTRRAIADPRAMVDQAYAMIRTPGVFDRGEHAGKPRWDRLCTGLLLLTGRRPVEIFERGTFSAIRGTQTHLMFGGQAKTRFAPGTRQKPYRIPVLAPVRELLRAVSLLRQSAPEYDKTSQRLSETVALEFPGYIPRDLRAVYARISYHAFAPEDETDTSWFAEVLGHKLVTTEAESKSQERTAEIADTATAAYYEKFYIPGLRRHRLPLPTFTRGSLTRS